MFLAEPIARRQKLNRQIDTLPYGFKNALQYPSREYGLIPRRGEGERGHQKKQKKKLSKITTTQRSSPAAAPGGGLSATPRTDTTTSSSVSLLCTPVAPRLLSPARVETLMVGHSCIAPAVQSAGDHAHAASAHRLLRPITAVTPQVASDNSQARSGGSSTSCSRGTLRRWSARGPRVIRQDVRGCTLVGDHLQGGRLAAVVVTVTIARAGVLPPSRVLGGRAGCGAAGIMGVLLLALS